MIGLLGADFALAQKRIILVQKLLLSSILPVAISTRLHWDIISFSNELHLNSKMVGWQH
jgi:hypothetical protein